MTEIEKKTALWNEAIEAAAKAVASVHLDHHDKPEGYVELVTLMRAWSDVKRLLL